MFFASTKLSLRAALLALGLLTSMSAQAAPRVSLPNGELTDSNTDMQVKVLGSAITIQRTWVNGRWYLNPAWAPLKFKLDRNDQSVKYVDRAGSVYERVGDGDIYQFDDHQFIRRVGENWLWYDRRGNSVNYSALGLMTDYRNQNDVTVRFDYDGLGQIRQIRDHFDVVTLTFTYTGIQLNRITDRTGRYVRYVWVGNLLKEVYDLDDKPTFYEYDNNGQLKEIETPENRITKVNYLQSFSTAAIASPVGVSFSGRPGRDFRISRVSTLENAEHEITKYDYDYKRDGRIFSVVVTTPLKRKLEYRYDFDGRKVTEINGTTMEYDRRRDGPNVEYVKNERGLITRTERDSYRNVLNVEHPDGTTETWKYLPTQSFVTEYTDQAGVVSKYKYNPRGQIIETREAVGTPLERLTTYGYDQYGQTTRVTRRHSLTALDPLKDATSTYLYDNYGNVTEATDPENNVVKMPVHDVMGNTLTVIDSRNKTHTMQYSRQGWLEKSISALGFFSESKYNFDGDRKKSISPIDGTRTATTEYFYDNDGRLIRTLDPLGGESKQHYDDEGRMDESEDARGVKMQMRYDSRGRMEKMIDGNLNEIETIYGDVTNALEGLVSGRKYPTYEETYKYDQMDRQVETKQVLSPTLSYISGMTYDAVGQVESQTDAKGRTSLRKYDELRRLTVEVDPILGETSYTYDERDNLRTVTDANGNTHTFTYDRLNRKKTEARPMGQTIRYFYDENGNLTDRISPNGAKRKFTYDADNRLDLEQHFLPNTTVASKTMSYSYDQRGLLTSYDDGLTSGSYIYDDKGQKTSESITFGRGANAFTKTIGRTYEDNGLPKTMTYPGITGTLNFTYDDNNQLKTYKIPGLAANNDTLTYEYRWNAIREITMPGNLKRTVTLDALQRPRRIEVKGYGPTPGNNGVPVMDHVYTYDEVSNVKTKTTLDGEYIYIYDNLDRLTRATPPLSLRQSANNPNGLPDEKYTYDGVHNRISSQHQPGVWSYNDNNELKAWGLGAEAKAIEYDLNGSTIKEETGTPVNSTREYVYDAQDRMVEVKDNSMSVAKYAYDPMGRRVWRQAGAEITWFLYSDEGLIQELASANSEIRTYGWNPGGLWGTDTVWQKDANGLFLTNNDHLHSTDVLTSALNGNNSWGAVRESFGKTIIQQNSGTIYLMRFAGQWEDQVGEFNQNWFREYEPQIGLYKKIDPMPNAWASPYLYAHQQPNAFIDQYGLFSSKGRWKLHIEFSTKAFDNVGWNNDMCNGWAVRENAIRWSNDYDALPESQLIENSHTHAMTQARREYEPYMERQPRKVHIVLLETPQQAEQKWRAWIESNLSKCTGRHLGYALHAVQDNWAAAHRGFQGWDGGYTALHIPPLDHIMEDTYPDGNATAPAVFQSELLIERYISQCRKSCCD